MISKYPASHVVLEDLPVGHAKAIKYMPLDPHEIVAKDPGKGAVLPFQQFCVAVRGIEWACQSERNSQPHRQHTEELLW